jgi:TonB family protein
MNRLQKKCFIATAGFHLLLLLILVFGSAFFTPRPKPDDSQVLDVIPANLIDAAFNSGVKGAQAPPPTPIPPTPKPVVTPPAPQPEPLKPAIQPPEPVKSTEPDTTKPPEHVIKPDLTQVTHVVPKNSTTVKSQDDSQAKLRATALKVLLNLKKNFTPATTVAMPGNSSVSYANYASVVKSFYEQAWTPPDNTDSDDANTKVSVTIASDGTVLTARIITPSGDASVDASVQRTLDRVTFIAPFPEGATEKERTYIINFNLKSKRMLE